MFNCILFKVIIFDSQDHARNGYQAKELPELKNSCYLFLIYIPKIVRLYDTYHRKSCDFIGY